MESLRPISEERRNRVERRTAAASPFSHHRLMGRRRGDRRSVASTTDAHISDLYPRHLLYITTTILLCCALDAHNTLRLITMGAVELNPLMDVVLQQSSSLFVMSKFALTGLALLILVPHHQERFFFKLFTAKQALYFALAIYLLLIFYQWTMF